MPVLTIILDGDGKFEEYKDRSMHRVESFTVTALEAGMTSGTTSVAFIIPLEDGSWVFAETSLKLLLCAADAFKIKYGDPR